MGAELLLQYAPQLLQFGLGALQGIGGAVGMATNKRPQFEIPESAKQALSIAEMRANSNMPNYNQAVQNTQLATANQLQAARESGNPMSVLPQLQANENAALRGVEAQNLQYRDQSQRQYQQQLQRNADYQEQQFQVNQFAPYADKQNRSNQLVGAGLSNITGAFDSAVSAALMDKLLTNQRQTNNWYDKAATSMLGVGSYLPNLPMLNFGSTQISLPNNSMNNISFMPTFGK